ncbi:hypothetical protein MTO96_029133 [Rhipicephalus appendiculatus]
MASAIQRECVPSCTRTSKRRHRPWITPEIMKAARQKRLLFRKASQTRCPITFQLAKAHQRSLKAAIHVEHQRYTNKVAKKATENPRVFWSYVNSLRSSRHHPSFNIQGKLLESPAEVSALFAEQFSSIYDQAPADDSELLEKFSPRDQGAHPTQLPDDDSRDDSLLLSATFSAEALSSAISKINPSPSPDGMAPAFFRLLAPQVLHGFRRDRSCDTALATLNQIVSHNLDNRTETDLIQLDLSNAFDTLNISLLLDKYADDTSILAPILSPTTTQDLQEYLTVIDSWIVSNHLKLSPAKSSVMKFSSARLPAKPSYYLRGIPLPTQDSMKILGVTFTSTLDFSLQVASVVAKARRVLGFVSRVSKPCGPATFALLYTSLVLPILEYGCAVWSPNQQHLIARIERVHEIGVTLYSTATEENLYGTAREYRLVGHVMLLASS